MSDPARSGVIAATLIVLCSKARAARLVAALSDADVARLTKHVANIPDGKRARRELVRRLGAVHDSRGRLVLSDEAVIALLRGLLAARVR